MLLATPAAAQQVGPPTAAPAAEQAMAGSDNLLAFSFADERMTVPVSIAGAGPYRFIIDTGSQRTVISRELAQTLGLPRGRDVRVTSVTGSTLEGTAVIPSLSVNTLKGQRIEAPAFAGANIGAAGMLGIDTLQGQAVVIDFDRGAMAVSASSRRNRFEEREPGEIVVRARSLFGQLVVTDAYVDGTRVRVVLDTGSAVSMGNLALRRKLARRKGAMTPVVLTSVTGGSLVADGGSVERLRIGELTIKQLPVAYADAAPFAHFGLADTPAMLLGMDALALFRRVEIDFANRTLRLSLPRELASR